MKSYKKTLKDIMNKLYENSFTNSEIKHETFSYSNKFEIIVTLYNDYSEENIKYYNFIVVDYVQSNIYERFSMVVVNKFFNHKIHFRMQWKRSIHDYDRNVAQDTIKELNKINYIDNADLKGTNNVVISDDKNHSLLIKLQAIDNEWLFDDDGQLDSIYKTTLNYFVYFDNRTDYMNIKLFENDFMMVMEDLKDVTEIKKIKDMIVSYHKPQHLINKNEYGLLQNIFNKRLSELTQNIFSDGIGTVRMRGLSLLNKNKKISKNKIIVNGDKNGEHRQFLLYNAEMHLRNYKTNSDMKDFKKFEFETGIVYYQTKGHNYIEFFLNTKYGKIQYYPDCDFKFNDYMIFKRRFNKIKNDFIIKKNTIDRLSGKKVMK